MRKWFEVILTLVVWSMIYCLLRLAELLRGHRNTAEWKEFRRNVDPS